MLPRETIVECRNADDGVAISVHSSGSGEVLLLLHGWTLDRHCFDHQLGLADQFQVARFDRRGFGESSAPPDLEAELGDVAAVIDALGTDPVHLVGMSQGARLALRYAYANPEKLRSLTVQGVILDGYEPNAADDVPIPLEHFRSLIEAGDLQAMRDEWLAHPLMSSDTLSPGDRELLTATVQRYSGEDLIGRGARRDETSPATMPSLRDLSTMSVPTLIVTGQRETAARKAHARKLLETLPNAREVTLPNCGHLSNLSRPHGYNELLRRFTDTLGV